MADLSSPSFQRTFRVASFVLVWGFTAWLIYPLVFLDTVTLHNATSYFYRSALGIIIIIILFGKTLFDLFFPLDTSHKKAALHVIFLTVYALIMAGGIILVLMRILLLYLKGDNEGTLY